MLSRSILKRALVSVGNARSGAQFHTVTTTTSSTNNPFSSSSHNNNSHDSSSNDFDGASNSNNNSDYNNDSNSSNNNNNNDENTIQVSGSQLMRFRINKPEQFYFSKGDSICRLCNEFVPNQQVRFHLVGAGPRGPSTHMGREIVLDSLVYYGKLGYDPAQVMRSWAYTLLSHPQYVRLPELLPDDPTDLQARAQKTHELLQSLKNLKLIDISISPHSERTHTDREVRLAVKRRVAFERLECIGDNAWGSNLSGRMLLVFPDKKWAHCQMHHSFNTFRDLAETNTNLERMFDLLDIAELLPPASRSIVGDGKIKADIFEAILGELNCALYAHESNLWGTSEEYTELNDEHLARVCIIIKHVLNEIFDLTLLCLMYLLGEHAIPIARELSLTQMISPVTPAKPAFDPGDTVRTRRPHFHKNFVPTITLPQPMKIISEEEKLNQKNENNLINAATTTSKFVANTTFGKSLKKKRTTTTSSTSILYGPAVNTTPSAKCFAMWDEFLSNEERLILDDERFNLRPQKRRQEENDGEEQERDQVTVLEGELSETPYSSSSSGLVSRNSTNMTTSTSQPPLRQATKEEIENLRNSSSNNDTNNKNDKTSITNEEKLVSRISELSLVNATTNNNNILQQQNNFRSMCPFKQLSKYPPHTYNPYGLASETWMARWQREEELKEIFDEDVCDNIGTVIAQFEATGAFGTNNNTNNEDKERRRNYPLLVNHVLEKIEEQSVAHHDEEEEEEKLVEPVNPLNNRHIKDKILEFAHPFRSGVTVGSDGASFGSLSSSINDVVNRTSVFDVNNNTSIENDEDDEDDTTSKLDIDEIKRRNAMLTGKRF